MRLYNRGISDLYGSSSMKIDKLQRVQNTLARVVSKTHRRDHITPVLADLHWLPVRYRIEYKIALLAYKALTIPQPQCLSELICLYETPRQLRPRRCSRPTVQQFLIFLGVLSAMLHSHVGTICPKVSFLT